MLLSALVEGLSVPLLANELNIAQAMAKINNHRSPEWALTSISTMMFFFKYTLWDSIPHRVAMENLLIIGLYAQNMFVQDHSLKILIPLNVLSSAWRRSVAHTYRNATYKARSTRCMLRFAESYDQELPDALDPMVVFGRRWVGGRCYHLNASPFLPFGCFTIADVKHREIDSL